MLTECVEALAPAFLQLRQMFRLLPAVKTRQTLCMCPPGSSGGVCARRLAALGHPFNREMSSHGCRGWKCCPLEGQKRVNPLCSSMARPEFEALSRCRGSPDWPLSLQLLCIYRRHLSSFQTPSWKDQSSHPPFPPTLPSFSFHNWSN